MQASKDLLNVYSVIADNPANVNQMNAHFDAEMLFIKYMVSDEGQQLIGNYGKSTYGQSLFSPFVPIATGATPNATLLSWIQNYAYIPANATECPAAYRVNATELYSASYDTLSAATLGPQLQLLSNGELQITGNSAENAFVQPLIGTYAIMTATERSPAASRKNL